MALNASGGNVGIGTTSPEDKLHIIGGSDSALVGGGYLVLGPTNAANISIDNNEIMARANGGVSNLALNVAGGDVNLVQNGGGNVGVGTNNAQARLHVVGGSDVSPASGGTVGCRQYVDRLPTSRWTTTRSWPETTAAHPRCS